MIVPDHPESKVPILEFPSAHVARSMHDTKLGIATDEVNHFNLTLLYKAAERGFIRAQRVLAGICYYRGIKTQDFRQAIKWYRKAAEHGDAAAQHRLAYCYARGKGVTQDCIEALKWYRRAAEQGNAVSQYELGNIYYKGKGVVENHIEAVKWYHKAAERGRTDAQYKLGFAYYTGDGVPQDYVQAYKWFSLVAKKYDDEVLFSQKPPPDEIMIKIENNLTAAQLAEVQRFI